MYIVCIDGSDTSLFGAGTALRKFYVISSAVRLMPLLYREVLKVRLVDSTNAPLLFTSLTALRLVNI